MDLKYNVIILPSAKNDLVEILDGIAEASSSVSSVEKWYNRIIETIISLEYMPERYATLELNPGYRLARVGKYAILYLVDKENSRVIVMRIVYARRNVAGLL